MTDDMAIRQALCTDAPAVIRCSRAAYQIHVQCLGYEPKPMVADYSDWIENNQVWVLLDGLFMMGVLVLEPEDNHVLIYSIAVHPEAQGRGKRLMAFAEQYAQDQGFDDVVLYTNEKMTDNVSFYHALGYTQFARRAHLSRANSWLVHMKKRIRCPS